MQWVSTNITVHNIDYYMSMQLYEMQWGSTNITVHNIGSYMLYLFVRNVCQKILLNEGSECHQRAI